MTNTPDRWQRWLLDGRFGGDPEARQQDLAEFLYSVRDKVLDKAQLRPDDTVLDVAPVTASLLSAPWNGSARTVM